MRTYILNATGADISPATIIICVVIAAICIFAVISYRKKLKNGCCGGGGDEVKHVKPQDTNGGISPMGKFFIVYIIAYVSPHIKSENTQIYFSFLWEIYVYTHMPCVL